MKKLLCIILAIVMMVSFTACGKETPEKATNNALKAVKSLNIKGMEKYFGEIPVDVDELDFGEITADQLKVVKKFLSKMSWEILGSVEDENTATVTVRLTTVNLVPIATEVAGELMGDAFSALLGGTMTEEELYEKAFKLIEEKLSEKDLQMVDNEFELDMSLTDDGWKIEVKESFINTIIGDLDIF